MSLKDKKRQLHSVNGVGSGSLVILRLQARGVGDSYRTLPKLAAAAAHGSMDPSSGATLH